MPPPSIVACRSCDLLQRLGRLPEGHTARCRSCGSVLRRRARNGIERTLALSLAAAVLFVVANSFPFLTVERGGDGTPVFFRRISVGQVVSSQLEQDSDLITTRIFVRAPYDARVHAGTRFWDARGIQAKIGADGVTIDTESVVSILVGGGMTTVARRPSGS